MGHYILIGLIVAALVGLQAFIFWKNLQQMRAFRRTFGEPGKPVKYFARKNENGQVIGIRSDFSNTYYYRIEDSIGEYLEANVGGNIDFQLIKDAVDRNCDSVEEDANAQIPLPLYIGLAGTMLGIIIGIGYLWISGQLSALLNLGQNGNGATSALNSGSQGIETLLSGVAMAMIASISGLTFTTIATWIFKGIKLEVEIGKNRFFTWMQSNLLPEVANDTVDAFRKLGKTLGRFNSDFSRNSEAFGRTMDRILGVNSTQNELLTNVEKMNTEIEEMSKRNLAVASRLSNVMGVLDDFANYVQSINGYTTELQRFTTMFNDEADRLHVMEQMKEFFLLQGQRLKDREDTLKKGMGKLDDALLQGTDQLKNRFTSSNDELKRMMTQQKDEFQVLLKSQTKMFEDAHKELISSIKSELGALPQTAATLNAVPEKIKNLMEGYKRENDKLVSEVSRALNTMNRTLREIGAQGAIVTSGDDGSSYVSSRSMFPKWVNWVLVVLVSIIALACAANTYFGYKANKAGIEEVVPSDETEQPIDSVAEITPPVPNDSIAKIQSQPEQKPVVQQSAPSINDQAKEGKPSQAKQQ